MVERVFANNRVSFKSVPEPSLVSERDRTLEQVISITTRLPSAGVGVLRVKLNTFWREKTNRTFSPCVLAQVSPDWCGS